MTRFNKKFGKAITQVSPETMERLKSYDWPGNIRELQNVIERAVIISNGPALALGPEFRGSPVRTEVTNGAFHLPASIDQVARRHIQDVLAQTKGVIEGVNGAAKILGLHPNTLRSRMRKLGISKTAA